MDFKQLEAFVRTAELKSFSKAAESIYLSQPSISLYVNSLEKEFNTQFFVRTTRDVLLTKNGKILYEYAKNILALKEEVIFNIQEQQNSQSGEIKICASSVPSQYILPEILVGFNKKYPKISFKIDQSDTEEVIGSVLSQQSEFGIVGAKNDNSKCTFEYITSEPLIIITPPDDKYSSINPCDFEEFFYNEKFVSREEGSGTRRCYENYLKTIGIKLEKLNIVAQLSNTQSIIHSVSRGLGISIVSELAASQYINHNLIKSITVDNKLLMRSYYFVFKKNTILPPMIKLFVDFVYAYYNDSKINCK